MQHKPADRAQCTAATATGAEQHTHISIRNFGRAKNVLSHSRFVIFLLSFQYNVRAFSSYILQANNAFLISGSPTYFTFSSYTKYMTVVMATEITILRIISTSSVCL